jgi:hemolysin activation/secretion protein
MHYSHPLTAADTLAEAYFRISDAEVIDGRFRTLGIRSSAETYGARISHPFVRSMRREVRPSLTYEYRESKNFLLGEGYSFSLRENDGVSRLSVARLGLEWIERDDDSVLVAFSTLNIGITGGGFISWFGRLIYMRRLGFLDSRIHARGEFQLADRALAPMEQYPLGGMFSVRGYHKNILLGDNGVNSSLEWIFPLLKDGSGNDLLSLVPFFDYGHSWNNGNRNNSPDQKQDLASIGTGLRCAWKGLSLALFYGYALLDSGANKTDDLQDHGISFLASWSFP